jgi:hypothetical protein
MTDKGWRQRCEDPIPTLLIARDAPITGINIRIVYPDKDIEEMVAEMRRVSKAQDDTGFHVEDETARAILKRRLGPENETGTIPPAD